MQLSPGDSFDRYVIEALLGSGGMGRVYLARDKKLDRRVALKFLRADMPADEVDTLSAAARMVREARAAAALDHPNIVTVYDAGVDGAPFIAMEYVDGRSLRAFVADDSIALARKLRWLLGVARALAAAHRSGLVHRDVKPSNVIVRSLDDVAKLFDFGVARRTDPGAYEGPTLTGPGQIVGTPEYMAPEQLLGGVVDARSDQFAWGVLAYTLLSGSLPWKASEPGAVGFAILGQPVETLVGRTPGLDPAVDRIVRRAVSKSAAERYAATDDLVTELEDALGERPEMTPRAGTRPPASVVATPEDVTRVDAPENATRRVAPPPVVPGEVTRGATRRAAALAVIGMVGLTIVGVLLARHRSGVGHGATRRGPVAGAACRRVAGRRAHRSAATGSAGS
jgi:serine/threonine-protein kinase